MAKTLSAFNGYGGIYEFDKELGYYQGTIYIYGHDYVPLSYFRAYKEEDINKRFRESVKRLHTPITADDPYTGSIKPVSETTVFTLGELLQTKRT